ncbi:MAG: hypothetical protein ACXWU8_08800 [Rhodoplanes sp.]
MRPSRRQARTGTALTILVALILAGAAALLGPRALEAGYLLLHRDDPVALADHVIRTSLDPAVAQREIEAALAANDPELAASFAELARGQGAAVDTDLARRVEAANSTMARTSQAAGSFAHGFVTGVPQDAVGLAGTAAGDLFVFGDIRDALREGRRLASGEEADELILGLALVGIAVTAGTYASLGVGAPARLGVSVIKGARKAGRIGNRLTGEISRSLRSAVDLPALKTAVSPVSLAQPATAVRAAREAVKLERAGGLVRLMEDTGRVQAKAGTRAAMDGLKVAETPKDMGRVARLAEAKGSRTRAILKLGGRAAIALSVASLNLASWTFSALVAIIGFCATIKGLTERATRRWLAWRKGAPRAVCYAMEGGLRNGKQAAFMADLFSQLIQISQCRSITARSLQDHS